jgi:predicted nicotinamide N-methyase
VTGYETVTETVTVAGHDYRLRRLKDRTQYFDPDGRAAAAGIPEASWCLFGLLWEASSLLAEHLAAVEGLRGRRLLEVGAGLALPSLVAHRAGAEVTVSDVHPLVPEFLAHNLALNDLPPLLCLQLDWTRSYPELEPFDWIVASDVLYEPEHPEALCAFVQAHGTPDVEVWVTDAGREEYRRFNRLMIEAGFEIEERKPDKARKLRLLLYRRPAHS